MSTTPKSVSLDPHGTLAALSRKAPESEPLPPSEDVEIQSSIRLRYPPRTLLKHLRQALETSPEILETLANLEADDSLADLILPFRLEFYSSVRATAELFASSPDMTPDELFRALRARRDESDREWIASMKDRTPSQALLDHDFGYRLGHQAFLTILAQILAHPSNHTLTNPGGNHA